MSLTIKSFFMKDDVLMDFSNFQKYFYSMPQMIKGDSSFAITTSGLQGGKGICGGVSIDIEGSEYVGNITSSASFDTGYLLLKITVSTKNSVGPFVQPVFLETIPNDTLDWSQRAKEEDETMYENFETTNVVYFRLYKYSKTKGILEDLRMFDILTTNKLVKNTGGKLITSIVNGVYASVDISDFFDDIGGGGDVDLTPYVKKACLEHVINQLNGGTFIEDGSPVVYTNAIIAKFNDSEQATAERFIKHQDIMNELGAYIESVDERVAALDGGLVNKFVPGFGTNYRARVADKITACADMLKELRDKTTKK